MREGKGKTQSETREKENQKNNKETRTANEVRQQMSVSRVE